MSAGPRIFISHSHKDNEFGVKLVEDLRRVLGDESAVWYDARGGLQGGDTWWRKIMQELRTRNTFIVVLSPDSVASGWVNSEIDLAWRQKHSPSGKLIIPLLYRQCEIRDDLDTLQFISFLPPRTYEESFHELLIALGLSPYTGTSKPTQASNDSEAVLIQQIETSFAAKDWPDVIRKTNFLLKHAPGAVTSEIYRMQGIALFEEGQAQQAQEAEQQRQEAERRRQEQEAAERREQEEKPLRDQRQQQLDQMARQQLTPLLNSLQLPQLLQDAQRCWQGSSLHETFQVTGNAGELNEPLRLTDWEYVASLTLELSYEYNNAPYGYATTSVKRIIQIHLRGDAFTQTSIAVEGIAVDDDEKVMSPWEEEITSSNTSKIVAHLKESIAEAIFKFEQDEERYQRGY